MTIRTRIQTIWTDGYSLLLAGCLGPVMGVAVVTGIFCVSIGMAGGAINFALVAMC